MRKALAAVSVLALLFAMTLPMVAMGTETTLPTVDETSRPPEHFTICHFTGLAGTEHFVELNLPWVAIFGQAGHFFENGTPRAGHEEDIFGPCPVTTTSTSTTTTSSTTTTTTEPTTTTTTMPTTTTTAPTTTTTEPPTPTQFCVDVNTAPQAELEELGGVNAIIALAIIAGRPYETVQDLADVLPPGVLLLILAVNAQTGAFASDTCLTPVGVTTTTTTLPGETTTTTTVPGSTTTPTTTPTTEPFVFGAAATVCVAEVPTIRITFANTFPDLAGLTGTLTMSDVDGNVVSTQSLVYEPGTTVDLLYPGTSVNPDGSIDDVPGWILTDDGLWVRDPSDEFLREGINLTYTVNPTATAFVTYPPESSECANPENPPGTTNPPLTISTPSPEDGVLPFTGTDVPVKPLSFIAGALGLLGLVLLVATRKGRIDST